MSTLTPNQQLHEAVEALARYGNVRQAADALGISKSSLHRRVQRAHANRQQPPVIFPEIPSGNLDALELVEQCSRRFTQLREHEATKVWSEFKVNIKGPFGICWFGDPHVDDNGCNWPLLRHDMKVCRETYGLFAANLGDTGNCWVGRLMRLWANQDTSKSTAAVLARYFVEGHPDEGKNWAGTIGMVWLLMLMGNHDEWDPQWVEWLRAIGGHLVPMYNWQARIVLACPNGQKVKVWAAHDFGKFSSQWNDLHSLEKAAKMKDTAHLYVAGHTHNWGYKKTESASRGNSYTLVRARGYKFLDEYGERLGHNPQQDGASVVTIINPDARSESGLVRPFEDVEEAAEFLTWLRQRNGHSIV